MDTSRALITEIIDAANLGQAKRAGITSDFLDEDCVPVFRYIERHYSEYKDVPSRDAVLKAFPNFEFISYKEPLEYYINSIKESFRKNLLEETINEVADVYSKDTKRAETLLRESLSQLNVTQKSFRDVSLAETAADRVTAYYDRKSNPGVNGISSSWPTLDYQTLGWHAEEFIVLVGEKYMGKSWILLWFAHQAALQGERVLFVTNEMSQDALSRRYDALFTQVPFDSLRRGELTDAEENRYKDGMERLAESGIHFTIARQGVQTVEDIQSKAVEVDATIIFGDSIYLFDPDSRGRWTGETNKRLEISRNCKRIAKELGIPFIVTVQAGRKATKKEKGKRIPNLDDIEWSNAFSQDAETVLYLQRDELDREIGRAEIYLLKSRDGDLTNFYVNQNFEYMDFSERIQDTSEPTTVIEFDEDDEVVDFDET